MKPLLVGEDNPYGSDPRYALYPQPEYSAGGRLCFKIMQLSLKEYIRDFDRVNLCSGKWSMKEAREKAKELTHKARLEDTTLVLFGSKVAKAFDLKFDPFTGGDTVFGELGDGGMFSIRVIQLPHPSGLNRLWNEDGAFERARQVLRLAKVLK